MDILIKRGKLVLCGSSPHHFWPLNVCIDVNSFKRCGFLLVLFTFAVILESATARVGLPRSPQASPEISVGKTSTTTTKRPVLLQITA